jgi:hypothetical protein
MSETRITMELGKAELLVRVLTLLRPPVMSRDQLRTLTETVAAARADGSAELTLAFGTTSP